MTWKGLVTSAACLSWLFKLMIFPPFFHTSSHVFKIRKCSLWWKDFFLKKNENCIFSSMIANNREFFKLWFIHPLIIFFVVDFPYCSLMNLFFSWGVLSLSFLRALIIFFPWRLVPLYSVVSLHDWFGFKNSSWTLC